MKIPCVVRDYVHDMVNEIFSKHRLDHADSFLVNRCGSEDMKPERHEGSLQFMQVVVNSSIKKRSELGFGHIPHLFSSHLEISFQIE